MTLDLRVPGGMDAERARKAIAPNLPRRRLLACAHRPPERVMEVIVVIPEEAGHGVAEFWLLLDAA
jgi:hypothetical protein